MHGVFEAHSLTRAVRAVRKKGGPSSSASSSSSAGAAGAAGAAGRAMAAAVSISNRALSRSAITALRQVSTSAQASSSRHTLQHQQQQQRPSRRSISHSAPTQHPHALAHSHSTPHPHPHPHHQQPPPQHNHSQPTRSITPIPDLPSLRTWFATHHPALALPDNVLLQLITHESHNLAHRHSSPQQGRDILTAGAHNRRLSFLGRRALHAFLALFLHAVVSSSTAQEARRAADEILRSPDALDVILHTGRLGDRPGRALELEQVMRWTPAHSEQERGAHDRGLYTIRGRTLEAFIGAIYHQHGANLASQTFHAHILPHIDAFPPDTPRTLWDAIKARADLDSRALVDLQAWAQGKRVELGYGSAALASPAQGKQVQ